jgi:hypothetical protein
LFLFNTQSIFYKTGDEGPNVTSLALPVLKRPVSRSGRFVPGECRGPPVGRLQYLFQSKMTGVTNETNPESKPVVHQFVVVLPSSLTPLRRLVNLFPPNYGGKQWKKNYLTREVR